MLLGRDAELTRVDDLLDAAARGRARVVIVEGDPGAGKSAVLDEARSRAEARGFTVLATRGRVADAEVAFAGLLGLIRPIEHHIDGLDPPLATGLRAALALERDGTDSTTVRVATFRLLARVAADAPLLVVLDDAEWLDAATTDALAFAVGRFDADAVALLVAARAGATDSPFADGASPLRLGGLRRDALAALVADQGPFAIGVLDACMRSTGGNVLAFRELVGSLDADQRSGAAALPRIPAPAAAIRLGFAHRLETVPPELQRALVLVAADDTGDRAVIDAALARLGEPPADLEAAEAAGIVEIDGAAVAFTHPLLRAVAYHGVAATSRRSAHTALAAALDQPHHAEARTWQLAAAATEPDAVVAEALELVARAAVRRGGTASGARTMERAASLSIDPDAAFARRAEAVAWWLDAGEATPAGRVAEHLVWSASTSAQRLTVALVLGARARLTDGPGPAADRLLAMAASVDEPDRALVLVAAAEALAAAGERDRAALVADGIAAPSWAAVASRAFVAPPEVAAPDDAHIDEGHLAPYPPPAPDLVIAALAVHRARLLARSGRHQEAMTEMDQVFLVPRSGTGPFRLEAAAHHAAAQAEVGDPSGAADALSRRLESTPNPSPASRRLAEGVLASLATRTTASPDGDGPVDHDRRRGDRRDPAATVEADPLVTLTAAERRVADVVGGGQSNRQAAESLFLSVKTVDYHLQNIYRKLGLRSRAELAVLVTRSLGDQP